jgi:hypothetical protein
MHEDLEGLVSGLADRYRIDVGPDGQPVVLGSGGMATVYRALDLRHDRHVAIKVLHRQLAAFIGADRFVDEIRVTAKLQHPHIVPLLDSGVVDAGAQRSPSGRPFYVMPQVVGETLAARLARDQRVPLSEALRIVEQVGSALDYAHEQGVIHRDIKPSNIILSSGFALVVDFGLARAIDQSASGGATSIPGLMVGTPRYMAPEQGLGEQDVSARSDLYSLGCVVYEMLAGAPPFTDDSPYTLLGRHRTTPAPSLRTTRPDLPRSVAEAVAISLRKAPAERFGTGKEFFRALSVGHPVSLARRFAFAGIAGAVAIAAWLLTSRTRPGTGGGGPVLDTMRYMVVPAEDASASALVQTSLERWTGISVVQPFQVQEAQARLGGGVLNAEGRRNLARELGAGRYVLAHVSPLLGRSRVDAVLYESARGTAVREASVTFAPTEGAMDSAFANLVDRLLLGVADPSHTGSVTSGSRSLPARQASLRGHSALAEWDLPRADSGFADALRLDPSYALAALWLAQVRVWSRAPPTMWHVHAEQAGAATASLTPDDRERAGALLALRRGDIPGACARWRALTSVRPADFAAWYSLASCLERDSVVVRDRASRSGWRFRSSYASALAAYRRAFELLPTVSRAFRRESYEDLQRLLWTSRTLIRPGWAAPPDTGWFLAYLTYQGDSITPIPFPALQVMTQAPPILPAEMAEAEVRQRYLFRDITANWVRSYPASASALEANAVGLDLLGDPTSVDTLRRARLLTSDPAERRRVAVSEVWLRLKLSLPSNEAGLRAVRALADSLLSDRSPRTRREALRLAGIAALTGRATQAGELAKEGAGGLSEVPAHLERRLRSLLVYASLGGPLDTLRAAELELERAIDESLPASLQGSVGLDWALATSLMWPDLTSRGLARLRGKGSPLVDAQAATAAGDSGSARVYLRTLRQARAAIPPHDVALDGLFAEARLLLALGDSAAAASWLDPTLNAIHLAQPTSLTLDGRPGALVRAIAFRAELASHLGDAAGARKWARAVVILWSDSDPFLKPIVRRMNQLTS